MAAPPPGAESAAALWAKKVMITTVVVSYFVISISLVFINKVTMDKKTSIEAPIFMTWFQCLCTVIICWFCGEMGKRAAPGSFFAQFPEFKYKPETAMKLFPLSMVFVGMITFNNLCLQYVEVSFYNVARSLTIVFNVVLTYFMLGETTSAATIGCLAIVVVGFFVGAEGEVNFSWVGTIFGVASSVFVSLNSIMTKKSMPVVEGNQWTLAAYNNVNALIMFAPIILMTDERNVLMRPESIVMLGTGRYWSLMVLSGVFGFLIGIVTILQIKVTSPLTHNISGTAKACVQTVMAFFIWGNETTAANVLGVILVLLGSSIYTYVRTNEMAAAKGGPSKGPSGVVQAAPSSSTAIEIDDAEKDSGGKNADKISLMPRSK